MAIQESSYMANTVHPWCLKLLRQVMLKAWHCKAKPRAPWPKTRRCSRTGLNTTTSEPLRMFISDLLEISRVAAQNQNQNYFKKMHMYTLPNSKGSKIGEKRYDKQKTQHVESLVEFLLGCKKYPVTTLYKRINRIFLKTKSLVVFWLKRDKKWNPNLYDWLSKPKNCSWSYKAWSSPVC